MSPRGKGLLLLAASLAGMFVVSKYRRDEAQVLRAFEGKAVPAFRYVLSGDGVIRSAEEWRGKPVILNFWGTWCGPCREEMPGLARAAKELEARGVHVVAISDEEREVVERFASRPGAELPRVGVVAPGGARFLEELGARPVTFAIGRDGTIREARLGAMEYEGFKEMAAGLL
ncbi:MAG: TlpA disulfide reductase family protein [Bryobacteraceae bacterium]|nr:TlpA disulfide reductase family protein [Bryobacteraceae bacterium]